MSQAWDRALERAGRALETGVAELVSGEDWLRAMRFAAQFRSRSFANVLRIWVQHSEAYAAGRVSEPNPTLVAGYKQWGALGRWPNQPGYVIHAPLTSRVAVPATGGEPRRLRKGERPRPGETVRQQIVGIKPVHVWDVSQTEGEPVPARPRPVLLRGEAPAGLWDGLATRIAAQGFALSTVESAAELGGANGITNFETRTVRVRADMDAAARVKTLAHELGHVLLHDPEEDVARPHEGIGEVEAESFALMVCAVYDLPTDGYSVPYVAGWASQVDGVEPADLVRALGEKVRTKVLAVLDHLPDPATGDGTPPGPPPDSPATSGRTPAPARARRGLRVVAADAPGVGQ
jgi:hypothetical protein